MKLSASLERTPQLGYTTNEEFIQDTIRLRLVSEEKQTVHNFKKGRSRM